MELDFASLLKDAESPCDLAGGDSDPSPFCRLAEAPGPSRPQPNTHLDASPADLDALPPDAHPDALPADLDASLADANMDAPLADVSYTPHGAPQLATLREALTSPCTPDHTNAQSFPASGTTSGASRGKKAPGACSYKAYKRKKAKEDAYKHGKRVSSAKKRVAAMASAVHHTTTLSSGELPAARDGYTSKNAHHPSKNSDHSWTVQELLGEGFSLVQWDGR